MPRNHQQTTPPASPFPRRAVDSSPWRWHKNVFSLMRALPASSAPSPPPPPPPPSPALPSSFYPPASMRPIGTQLGSITWSGSDAPPASTGRSGAASVGLLRCAWQDDPRGETRLILFARKVSRVADDFLTRERADVFTHNQKCACTRVYTNVWGLPCTDMRLKNVQPIMK